jgi:hypothetical protein
MKKLEGERDSWRQLKDGQSDRVEQIVEETKTTYRARNFNTSMPRAIKQKIRQHAEAEEAAKVAKAQQAMLTAQQSAREVIQTVRWLADSGFSPSAGIAPYMRGSVLRRVA